MNTFPSEKSYAELDVVPQGVLRPITTFATGRYSKQAFAYSNPLVLTPGYQYSSEARPQYLPPHWAAYFHPEGQLYFCRNSFLHVTTEEYLYAPDKLAKVLYWAKYIEAMLEEKNIPVVDTVELFIMIEDTGCAYYLVDHATRSQFWLEPVENQNLDIPDVDSPSHLKMYLEQLYWGHVEHFPMHFGGLPVKLIDELICIFSHAMIDHTTSKTSTFFYCRSDCSQFVEVLKLAREYNTDGHQVCAVARLWKQVCNNRFQTHYGQETSRLSRDQAIIYDPPQHSRISKVSGWLTFRTSDRFLAQLTDVFVDHLVYISEWQPFIKKTLRGWRRASFGAFALLLLHAFLLVLEPWVPLAIVSASLSGASLLTAALLMHRYDRLEDATATQAYEHLEAIHSERYDFQFVALAYALPQALQLWGLGFFIANFLFIIGASYGMYYGIGAALCTVILSLWVQQITSETAQSRVGAWFGTRNEDEECMV